MKYRKDIQLLRGISVIMVVLFHLDLKVLKSGFLGVDIFFAISGFLMAVLYDKDVRFRDFVYKRARRLLPAYFVTILLTLIGAFILTIPNEFNSVAEQSIYGTFLISNIGFWQGNSYFVKSAFQPLLHLWSLGLEVQFYLLAPLLFRLFDKKKIFYPICLLLSMAACFYLVGVSPKTAFFILPFRLWEFLFGYGIANYLTSNGSVKVDRSLSWIGGAALVATLAIPLININGKALTVISGHPGLYALLVCLITSMVLIFGVPRVIEDSPVGDFLELVGKYSYSIYLVHYPVIVLFLYKPFSGTSLKPNSLIQGFIILTLTTILSVLMYHFVENPIRHKNKQQNKKSKNHQLWFSLAALILLVAWVAPSLQQNKFAQNEKLIFGAWQDRSVYRCGKMFRLLEPKSLSCELTQNINNPSHRILLVGNSHADAIKNNFSRIASNGNMTVRFMVKNNPLIKGGLKSQAILREAKKHQIDSVVFHYNPAGFDFAMTHIEKMSLLAQQEGIYISVIMPVPMWEEHIPQAMWNHLHYGESLPQQDINEYQLANQELAQRLAKLESNNFKIYQLAPFLCQEDCSFQNDSGKPFYFDRGHLTLTGSQQLTSLFQRMVDDNSALATHK